MSARSFIGQSLVADIELTSLASPNTPVQVELASRDVYLAANVAMTPVLSGLAMVVERRGGRQILHIRSSRAVDTPHLHLFFELTEGGNRAVRTATVWLAANPNPKPGSVAAPAAANVKPAPAVRPRAPQMRFAAVAPAPTVEATPPDNEAGLKYQNGVLTAKLAEVEEKMRQLQTSLGVPADAGPGMLNEPMVEPIVEPVADAMAAAPVPLAAQPAKPSAAASAKPAKALPAGKSPWFWVGIGALVLLVLAAAAGLYILRHRSGQTGGAEAGGDVEGHVEGDTQPPRHALTALWHRLRERLRRKHWTEGAQVPGQPESA
ncbi:type IV pilus assembly protein FimV [Massilia glaciei]|uniref:type IV pilus assembly protein FimV n=1 Tax=Massilia glaciei TaxID=1524097 RepID=UPI0015E81F47|nr:hypothetical protein [Massilia glaciei]